MNIQWEAGKYTENFDFVHRYGESVLELVEAEAGGLVVDLGCGNGALTQKLGCGHLPAGGEGRRHFF